MGAVCGRPFYYPLLIQLSHSHSQSLAVPPTPRPSKSQARIMRGPSK